MSMQGNSSDRAKQSLDKATKLFRQNDFAKQLVAGSASGWFGTILRHTGKGLALIAGSGIIIYEIAHHHGYVKQDWNSLKELAQKKTQNTPAVGKVRAFAKNNRVFTAGFVGGFLIGVAF